MAWLNQGEKEEIATLYRQGFSTHKIALILGKGVTTIKRAVQKQCLPKNDYVYRELDIKIAELYTEGMSMPVICKTLELNIKRVLNGIKRSGIAIRSISQQFAIYNPSIGRKHTTETKINLSKIVHERYKDRIVAESYREKRGKRLHPKNGLTENAWHRILLKEADFTCQISGLRGVKLNVHHLDSVKDSPDKAWELNNLIVISQELHKEFHYGFMGNPRKPCTSDDWKAFLAQRK